MKDFNKLILVLVLIIAGFLIIQSDLTGRSIQRGSISCGEVLNSRFPSTITLSTDDPITQQTCRTSNGLKIQQNYFTLDCNGHTLRSSSGYLSGILIKSRSHVTVKNCVIEGFNTAIKISSSDDNFISNNSLSGLNFALTMEGRSGGNTITGNIFSLNNTAIYWKVYEIGNSVYGNDFYSGSNFEFKSSLLPIVCAEKQGNYLATGSIDTNLIQSKSSCGRTNTTFNPD